MAIVKLLLILHNVYFQYLLFKSKEGMNITLNFNVINILILPQI
jgi:hypothetical protein